MVLEETPVIQPSRQIFHVLFVTKSWDSRLRNLALTTKKGAYLDEILTILMKIFGAGDQNTP